MRVAIIGRFQLLIASAKRLISDGHLLTVVWTAQGEAYYSAQASDFETLASESGVPFREVVVIGSSDFDFLRMVNSDIAVSINFPTILGAEVISVFPFGILNAHAGDLPLYRGNACSNWALLVGEEKVGLTIHKMTPELDAGPVVLKRHFALGEDVYIGDVYRWIESVTPEMFSEAVKGSEDGTLVAVPQSSDPRDVLRVFPRSPEDGLIDWDSSVDTSLH